MKIRIYQVSNTNDRQEVVETIDGLFSDYREKKFNEIRSNQNLKVITQSYTEDSFTVLYLDRGNNERITVRAEIIGK